MKELDEASERLKVLEKEKAEFVLKKHEIETSVKPVAPNLEQQVNALFIGLVQKESGLQEAMTILAESNALNENLRKTSEIETSIAKLQTAVSSKEKDRGHAIKTIENRMSEAKKKASLIEQTVCKGVAEYARCPFIKDAVEGRASLGTLQTQLVDLNRPLDIPEIKGIEELKKQLSSLDPAVIKNKINSTFCLIP